MGHFYVDDSVHDEAGFIIGACVYTNSNVDSAINSIVKAHGFDSENFEFKSNTNYTKEPEKAKVRSDLKQLFHDHCNLGIVVIPREYRDSLGFECIKAIKCFVDTNEKRSKPLYLYTLIRECFNLKQKQKQKSLYQN